MLTQAYSHTARRASGSPLPADVEQFYNVIVNLFFVGTPGHGQQWTLVDAGLPMSAPAIIAAAEKRFGKAVPPNAIVLTHGHFDHTGSLVTLAEHWDVPIWAHRLEAPYLTGKSAYPPPDPTVGGGVMARLSPLYPKGPIDVSSRLQILPDDGQVPPMPEWEWVHTPGHTAGHISLYRPTDRTLIVGDAFTTTKQESAIGALSHFHSISGPPKYFTSDWGATRSSIERLAKLNPYVAFVGHGNPVSGALLRDDLSRLLRNFNTLALPRHGRYLREPAITDDRGTVSVPPPVFDPVPKVLGTIGLTALLGVLAMCLHSHHERQ